MGTARSPCWATSPYPHPPVVTGPRLLLGQSWPPRLGSHSTSDLLVWFTVCPPESDTVVTCVPRHPECSGDDMLAQEEEEVGISGAGCLAQRLRRPLPTLHKGAPVLRPSLCPGDPGWWAHLITPQCMQLECGCWAVSQPLPTCQGALPLLFLPSRAWETTVSSAFCGFSPPYPTTLLDPLDKEGNRPCYLPQSC